jgi:hypothetical protein
MARDGTGVLEMKHPLVKTGFHDYRIFIGCRPH